MNKIKSCECNRLLALNNANKRKRLDFKILKLASFCKNFSFVGLYIRFDITDSYVLLCQNNTEYVSW